MGPGSAARHAATAARCAASGARSLSGPLFRLGLLLHIGAQNGVDTALIAFAFLLEEVEHVFIDANGDRLLPGGYDQHGVRPVDILELSPVGIIRDRGFDFL